MSSSEQAPEPTMDEILASIRKIIADDDESSASAPQASPNAASHDTAYHDTASHEAGHAALAGDIASAMGHQDPSGEAEDDIFDLTHQVHEPAPQPSPAGFAPPAPPQYSEPPQPASDPFAAPSLPETGPEPAPEAGIAPPVTREAPQMSEMPRMPREMPEPLEPSFPVAQPEEHGMASAGGVFSGAPMEQAALPEDATGFGAREPVAPAEEPAWQTHEGAHRPAEAAGDAAIGSDPELTDLDSFSPGQGLGGGDRVHEAFAESNVVAASGMPSAHEPSAHEPSAHELGAQEDFGSQPADPAMPVETDRFGAEPAAPAPTPEAEFVAQASDPVIVPPAPEPALAHESPADAPDGDAAEDAAPDAAASRKSLEDSVKEMLRPMLRAWLDDNMPRIVESAVRDELQSKHNQF